MCVSISKVGYYVKYFLPFNVWYTSAHPQVPSYNKFRTFRWSPIDVCRRNLSNSFCHLLLKIVICLMCGDEPPIGFTFIWLFNQPYDQSIDRHSQQQRELVSSFAIALNFATQKRNERKNCFLVNISPYRNFSTLRNKEVFLKAFQFFSGFCSCWQATPPLKGLEKFCANQKCCRNSKKRFSMSLIQMVSQRFINAHFHLLIIVFLPQPSSMQSFGCKWMKIYDITPRFSALHNSMFPYAFLSFSLSSLVYARLQTTSTAQRRDTLSEFIDFREAGKEIWEAALALFT